MTILSSQGRFQAGLGQNIDKIGPITVYGAIRGPFSTELLDKSSVPLHRSSNNVNECIEFIHILVWAPEFKWNTPPYQFFFTP